MNSTETPPTPVTTCLHHWIIEPPNGPVSQGKCKRCGELRAFFNSPELAVVGGSEASPAATSEAA